MARKATPATNPSGWVGWVYFASALLMVVGGLHIISGLTGIFRDDFYVVGQQGLVAFNYTTWGWINLILGVLVLAAGFGVASGRVWARIVGVFLAVLVMIDSIAFLSSYPLWSIISLILTGMVVYALTLHGDEVVE